MRLAIDQPDVKVWQGDCVEVMRSMEPESIDAIVCDPPYGLAFMGKVWDSHVVPKAYQEWCEAWASEALRILKPGGWLLAFGGTRTYHRLASGVEDAGFEVRDMIEWLYGSGFPKSHDVSKAIDKAAGAQRVTDSDVPATPEAERWQGWGTALKPAHEPIIVARKPLVGTVAANVLAHGTGALNIDGTRIGEGGQLKWEKPRDMGYHGGSDAGPVAATEATSGRWPANVILSHSEGCRRTGERRVRSNSDAVPQPDFSQVTGRATRLDATARIDETSKGYSEDGFETVEAWACVPDCPVAMLDQQSGDCPTGAVKPYTRSTSPMFPVGTDLTYAKGADTGGASRFFYCAKAARDERERGLMGRVPCAKCEGLSTREHVGASGKPETCRRNVHPTVKPKALMAYLVRLVTPPGGTVLDPFAGSGTTLWAARSEGFGVVGIELDEDGRSMPVIAARLAMPEQTSLL